MKRIAALMLRESDRLGYSAYLRSLYRDLGLWETYAFLPVILLEGFNFDDKLDIKDGSFTFSGSIAKIDDFTVAVADQAIENIKPALFITKGSLPEDFLFEKRTVKAKSLLLIEYDEESYRVIRQRPLRMDK